jgi:hypothetical protein
VFDQGECASIVCADTDCGYYIGFGYDCTTLTDTYGFDCTVCEAEGACPVLDSCQIAGGNTSYQGDGWCDSINNNADCGYDDGDCCPCDCTDGTYSCASYGGDCDDCVDTGSSCSASQGECASGCTDSDALNYDELATVDDASCVYNCSDLGVQEYGYAPGDLIEDCDDDCFHYSWYAFLGDGYCDDGVNCTGLCE